MLPQTEAKVNLIINKLTTEVGQLGVGNTLL